MKAKKKNHASDPGDQTTNSRHGSLTTAHITFETKGASVSVFKRRLFKLQITTHAENAKIQLTPKITNHLFTYCLNCTYKSNPVYESPVMFLLASYVE